MKITNFNHNDEMAASTSISISNINNEATMKTTTTTNNINITTPTNMSTITTTRRKRSSLLSSLLLRYGLSKHSYMIVQLFTILIMVKIFSFLLQQQHHKRHLQQEKLQYNQQIQWITSEPTSNFSSLSQQDIHTVADLYCDSYGGPYDAVDTNEMIYWKDIPSDRFYQPIHRNHETDNDDYDHHDKEEQFITLEPDSGGWNNIRMSLETAVAISLYTGRTLVLPPSMTFYLLSKSSNKTQNILSFNDFFHFDSIQNKFNRTQSNNRPLFKVMSFNDFLESAVLKRGIIIDPITNKTSFPPNNWTKEWQQNNIKNYESTDSAYGKLLWNWLRNVTKPLTWNSDKCVAIIPNIHDDQNAINIQNQFQQFKNNTRKTFNKWRRRIRKYDGNPTPAYSNFTNRLLELLSRRTEICIYDTKYQKAPIIHLMGNHKSGYRMLQHYYTFLLHENYHTDLWVKRFIRDQLRYIDQVQCCAARIIKQLKVLSRTNFGTYDAIHIRRGDFQFKDQRLSAEEIYENNIKHLIPENRTLYISTDEKNRDFFKIFHEHYNVYYLDDFMNEIQLDPNIVSPNYYGMIEQLICSRSNTFFGTYYSTFSGYINRLRGYHAQNQYQKHTQQQIQELRNYNNIGSNDTKIHDHKNDMIENEYNQGLSNSYYTVPDVIADKRTIMKQQYHSIERPFWSQEWPIGWRDIDYDVA